MANWSEHKYPVMEQFLTVQGEGAHTGKSAWFHTLGWMRCRMRLVRCERKLGRGGPSQSELWCIGEAGSWSQVRRFVW